MPSPLHCVILSWPRWATFAGGAVVGCLAGIALAKVRTKGTTTNPHTNAPFAAPLATTASRSASTLDSLSAEWTAAASGDSFPDQELAALRLAEALSLLPPAEWVGALTASGRPRSETMRVAGMAIGILASREGVSGALAARDTLLDSIDAADRKEHSAFVVLVSGMLATFAPEAVVRHAAEHTEFRLGEDLYAHNVWQAASFAPESAVAALKKLSLSKLPPPRGVTEALAVGLMRGSPEAFFALLASVSNREPLQNAMIGALSDDEHHVTELAHRVDFQTLPEPVAQAAVLAVMRSGAEGLEALLAAGELTEETKTSVVQALTASRDALAADTARWLLEHGDQLLGEINPELRSRILLSVPVDEVRAKDASVLQEWTAAFEAARQPKPSAEQLRAEALSPTDRLAVLSRFLESRDVSSPLTSKESDALSFAGQRLAHHDPEAFQGQALTMIDQPDARPFLMAGWRELAQSDPALLSGQLGSLPSGPDRDSLIREWAAQAVENLDAAQTWAGTIADPHERALAVEALAIETEFQARSAPPSR